MTAPTCRAVGETGLLVGFGDEPNDAAFAQVLALDRALAAEAVPGLVESEPAYTGLLLVFDPCATDHATIEQAARRLLASARDIQAGATTHVVPVAYEGPDLAEVAARTGLDAEGVIAAHLAGDYRVVMYGFAPGYAYLGGVPAALRLPRKAAAVRGVPVGSVMIAGGQCLITTLPMPTGWWVIGRTDFAVLDTAAKQPFRLSPGDVVRFERAAA